VGELVELVDYDHFKVLLLLRVELLATSDFFDQLLHDHSVVVICFGGCHLEVIDRREHNATACYARSGANFVLLLLRLDFVDRV